MVGPFFFSFFARRGRGGDQQRPIVHPLSALASTLLKITA